MRSDGKKEVVRSRGGEGDEELSIELETSGISEMRGEDLENQCEKSDVNGMLGSVYKEELANGKRDSLNKA